MKGASEMRLPHLTFALILAVCATTLADDSIDSVLTTSKAQICLMPSKGHVRPPASTKRHFGRKASEPANRVAFDLLEQPIEPDAPR
jgi:hypothetical protein